MYNKFLKRLIFLPLSTVCYLQIDDMFFVISCEDDLHAAIDMSHECARKFDHCHSNPNDNNNNNFNSFPFLNFFLGYSKNLSICNQTLKI